MTGILDGKTAVVTGGGSGLGEAIARRFANAGCSVVVAGRRQDLIEQVAADIGGLAVATDVTLEGDVAALMKACDDAYGRLDILVSNAGAGGGGVVNAEDIDIGKWDETFAINVRGVVLSIKYAVPLLKRQGGSIITMASIAGLRPNARQAAYGASKAAVISITQAIAYEVGEYNIRANSLCPGAIDTDLYRSNAAARAARAGQTVEDDMARLAGVNALGRLATREDVAAAALYLAGEDATAITGTHLRVDAGKA